MGDPFERNAGIENASCEREALEVYATEPSDRAAPAEGQKAIDLGRLHFKSCDFFLHAYHPIFLIQRGSATAGQPGCSADPLPAALPEERAADFAKLFKSAAIDARHDPLERRSFVERRSSCWFRRTRRRLGFRRVVAQREAVVPACDVTHSPGGLDDVAVHLIPLV